MNSQNKKIHILMIGPGTSDIGGVTTFVHFILNSAYLNQRFIITHMDTARGPQNQSTAGRLSVLNLSFMLQQIFKLCKILVIEKPQIVHLNVTAGLSFWKSIIFIIISRIFHAKAIAHIHGGDFNRFYDTSGNTKRKLISRTLALADVMVVLSGWWRAYIERILPKNTEVEVIPNAPDESFFYSLESDQTADGKDGNTILFVGSIGKRKGIFDILSAIPIVVKGWDAARFIFLGEEEIAGEKENVLQTCRENNLLDHVRFAGWVTGDEKRKYYQQADIFILPSYAENLPFSLLEAMAVGLPVVTTPVGGIPELVEDGRNGFLIRPGNYQDLAESTLRLLKNSQLREELGRNARLRIQQQYSPRRIEEQWETLYVELLKPLKNKSQRLTSSV